MIQLDRLTTNRKVGACFFLVGFVVGVVLGLGELLVGAAVVGEDVVAGALVVAAAVVAGPAVRVRAASSPSLVST